MLGRQGFRVQGQFRRRYVRALKAAGIDAELDALLQEDGYSETLLRTLGLGEVEAMDFSDFEGAGILQDLNRPVPAELEGQFGFIFDGGTIEHVFDVPQALRNVFTMLAPGGLFVSANGMTGWPGHGIYQFSPEIVWTFWGRTCGCRVHRCLGVHKLPNRMPAPMAFPDPAETGKRLRLKGRIPEGRIYLYYEVERTPGAQLGDVALQSDYETKWAGHGNAGKTRFEITEEAAE